LDPVEEGARSVTALHEQGQFVEAAAARSKLRQLVAEMPVEADAFPSG
jgi:hypothetical protein